MGALSTLLPKVTARRVPRRRAGAYCLVAGVSVGWALFGDPQPLPTSWKLGVGVVLALAFVGSDLLYRALTRPLGRPTAYAAVCLAWAAAWSVLALSSSSCLTASRTTRCAPSEVAQFSAVGLLFPLLVPAALALPWLTYRAGRRLVRAVRDRSTR